MPKLKRVPAGVWLCPYCVQACVDVRAVAARQAANARIVSDTAADVAQLFAANRQRLSAELPAYDGRHVICQLPGPGRTEVPTWGFSAVFG